MTVRNIMKIKIPEKFDRRIKADKEIRTKIIDDYISGNYNLTLLSEKYGLSRTTIRRILFLEVKEKEKQYKKHYNKNNIFLQNKKKHYYYKKKLYEEGKIK